MASPRRRRRSSRRELNTQRLNLLLIWTDEQRADTLACYGNNFVTTPNLNRLAQQSAVFSNAYCVQPVCTPSRGTIMTGMYPHRHGARANNAPIDPAALTIAQMIGPDYRRAYFGKWHLGDEIVAQHGFDLWKSTEDDAYRAYYSKPEYLHRRSDYHHYLERLGYPPDIQAGDGASCYSRNLSAAMPARHTKAHFLGREAAGFIREQGRDEPFFLSVNFLEPHMPFFGPYNDRYDPEAIPVGPAFCVPPNADASVRNRVLAAQYAKGFDGWALDNPWQWRRLLGNYYGLVTLVDEAIGMILDALEQSGLGDNTIVAFTSDHGEMMGDHALLSKGVMYEESVRIPWLIRARRVQPRTIPGRISQIDLAPTLLELMGQPLNEHLQGVSRASVVCGQETLAGNDVFTLWHGGDYQGPPDLPGFTAQQLESVGAGQWRNIIAADGWKLNLCALDQCELYDLNTDPHEMRNLYNDPSQRDRKLELARRIRAWQQRIGDDCPLPSIT